jgi:hypothetical protein
MGYQAELAAVVTETETREEVEIADEGEPIRLFDRKRTRARKQKSTNGAQSAAEAAPTASEELKVTLDEAVVEDAAVISQFVANGNGNGNGAHDFDTISGSAEVIEEELTVENTDEADIVKSTSSGR